MNPTRSLLSAPLTVAAAIAARTHRIKIGTAVQILPLGHPRRLADETATIDQISGGRLIFGIGRSAFPRAYNAYGISYEESPQRFAESLEIIKKAWTQENASHHGRWHSFEDFTLVPRPVQQPHPEIRIAASQQTPRPSGTGLPAIRRWASPLPWRIILRLSRGISAAGIPATGPTRVRSGRLAANSLAGRKVKG